MLVAPGREPGHCDDNSLIMLLNWTSRMGLAGVEAALVPTWEDLWTRPPMSARPRVPPSPSTTSPAGFTTTPRPGVDIGIDRCFCREAATSLPTISHQSHTSRPLMARALHSVGAPRLRASTGSYAGHGLTSAQPVAAALAHRHPDPGRA